MDQSRTTKPRYVSFQGLALGLGALLAVATSAGTSGAQAPRSAADSACDLNLRENTIVRSQRRDLPLECKLAVAAHNRKVAASSVASARGRARSQALGQQKAWERLHLNAQLAIAQRDYDKAKSKADAATGSAKHVANQALEKAQARLNDVAGDAEGLANRMASEARGALDERRQDAKKRSQQLKQKWASATGEAKDKLEAQYLRAERSAKRLEEMLGKAEVAHAQRKLSASMKKVGVQAEAAKARTRAELERVKSRVEGAERRVKKELEDIESKAKNARQRIKDEVDDAKDEIEDLDDDIRDQVKNTKNGFKHEVQSLGDDLKDVFDFD